MSKKKTQEQWEKEYKGLTGDEYTFLEPYQKSNAKIACRHNKCGYEWKVTPHHFLHDVRCPKCNSGNKKTNEEWLAKVKELKGDEFTFLDEYVDNKTKLTCLHNVCGNKFEITPRDFKSKKRKHKCPYCKKPGTYKGIEVYQKRLEKAFDDSYVVIEKIEDSRAKLKIKHKPCGSETVIRADYINDWHGCPNCIADKSKQNGDKARKRKGLSPVKRRVKRGLFKSNKGILINADVNGALQILRKVVPNAFADGIDGIGLVPVKLNLNF